MDLFTIVLVLVVVGVLLWAINAYIPMDGKIKKVLNITTVCIVIFWLLKVSGLLNELKSISF